MLARADASELAFRRRMDPHGLMNPGKFTGDEVAAQAKGSGATLPTSGWRYKQAV